MMTLTHVQLTDPNAPRAVVMQFGKPVIDTPCGEMDRTVSFRPGSVFALVRCRPGLKSTHFHLSILRAVKPSEPASKVEHVWPGAQVLLRLVAWDKVMCALRVGERIKQMNIYLEEVDPEYWSRIHRALDQRAAIPPYTYEEHGRYLIRRGRGQEADTTGGEYGAVDPLLGW